MKIIYGMPSSVTDESIRMFEAITDETVKRKVINGLCGRLVTWDIEVLKEESLKRGVLYQQPEPSSSPKEAVKFRVLVPDAPDSDGGAEEFFAAHIKKTMERYYEKAAARKLKKEKEKETSSE